MQIQETIRQKGIYMSEDSVSIEQAIAILMKLVPDAVRGVSAEPGHRLYEAVRRAGPLSRCRCGQRTLGWQCPEFIAKRGNKVWTVGYDARTNKISCGPNGYHSPSYSEAPPCC